MGRPETIEASELTIVEAVETLSRIADLDLDRDIGIAQKHDVAIQGNPIVYRTIRWLHEQDAAGTIGIVKDTFRVVLKYLRNFYRKEFGYLTDANTIEGIKTIMVLVGDAAQKLDRFTILFQGSQTPSVTLLKEYKALQDFYQKRIARKVDESMLGKWILALTGSARPAPEVRLIGHVEPNNEVSKHAYVDLDTVKKDTEYELFFMHKEDGTRFFNPRLLRNLKLVCDFGEHFSNYKGDDPLVRAKLWHDSIFQMSAQAIWKGSRVLLDRYYREVAHNKESELVEELNKTIMALSMAANPRNLMRNRPVKTCSAYFSDFQQFLRSTLSTRDYERYMTYPPNASNKFGLCIMDTIDGLCQAQYTAGRGCQELQTLIVDLIRQAGKEASRNGREKGISAQTWWDLLHTDYMMLNKFLKRHHNGPLYKVLELLKDERHRYFDPIVQENLPHRWFDLIVDSQVYANLRIPVPVRQDFIHRASVTDEFKGFLHWCASEDHRGKHLLINLQDRTSWREHQRCKVLEELQDRADFAKTFCVVTLACDTEFYHQMAPYADNNHATTFLKQFQEHLESDDSGYYFPGHLRKSLLGGWLGKLLRGVHIAFFNNRNVLLRRDRLDFIQVTYLCLVLKILELKGATTFSLTCKDGVDLGSSMSAMLFAFLKILSKEQFGQGDMDYLRLMLFGPAILIRERNIIPERFTRAQSAIKSLAQGKEDHGWSKFQELLQGHIKPLFKTDILQIEIATPKPTEWVI